MTAPPSFVPFLSWHLRDTKLTKKKVDEARYTFRTVGGTNDDDFKYYY